MGGGGAGLLAGGSREPCLSHRRKTQAHAHKWPACARGDDAIGALWRLLTTNEKQSSITQMSDSLRSKAGPSGAGERLQSRGSAGGTALRTRPQDVAEAVAPPELTLMHPCPRSPPTQPHGD